MAEIKGCDRCKKVIANKEDQHKAWMHTLLAGKFSRVHDLERIRVDACTDCYPALYQAIVDWSNGKTSTKTIDAEVVPKTQKRRGLLGRGK